jgi:hypothetical protein
MSMNLDKTAILRLASRYPWRRLTGSAIDPLQGRLIWDPHSFTARSFNASSATLSLCAIFPLLPWRGVADFSWGGLVLSGAHTGAHESHHAADREHED